MCWRVNNFYVWEMSQKLLVDNFQQFKNTPYFNEKATYPEQFHKLHHY